MSDSSPRDLPHVGMAASTRAVRAGRPPAGPDQPLNTALTMASVFTAGGEREYGRSGNPTWEAFESALGSLEGGRCVAYASGLAAVATILDLVSNGEKVVAPRHAYLGTIGLLADLEARERVTTALVDLADGPALAEACEDAALLWLESPTNPALETVDLESVTRVAHRAGARVVVDNTFATPLRQRPLEAGADLVVHSATKLIGGHSDLLLGAVVVADDEQGAELEGVLRSRRQMVGSVPGTLETWLALRGLRTLPVRLDRAEATARELATRLAMHPAVQEARYPGFGSILAPVLADAAAADRLVDQVRLWTHATSLGGVESTLERRRRWALEAPTIPEGLVRLSVGLEDVEDLWRDLAGALG